MTTKWLIFGMLSVTGLWAQRITDRRTGDIRGGDGDGKCTIEVVVDGVADVEVRGRDLTIRTLNGAPSTIRRFQCNQEMPANPYEFRFKGIDGRGRQDLVRQPANGRPAVIRIEDSKGGNEGYTFDIFWRGGGGFSGGGGRYNRPGRPGYNGGGYDNSGWNNGWGNGNGWVSNGNFNFEGGRRGAGSYQDRNGRRRRLDQARVSISNSGNVNVAFESDSGRIDFNGSVDRRDGRRIYTRVNGSGMFGMMEIEMSSNNAVRRISLSDVQLSWNN